MKRLFALLLAALLPVCLALSAWAEEWPELSDGEGKADRFLGGWMNDDFNMYIRVEDEEIFCCLSRIDEAGDIVCWEFVPCGYVEEDDSLFCPTCIHYRERIDMEAHEIVQEDWSLIGLGFTRFAFGEDEDTLVGSDIPEIEGALEFRRTSDEEYFGM